MNTILKRLNISYEFILLNYAALFFAIVNSFLKPHLFSVYFDEASLAILMLFYGYSIYLAFLDGGVSKPLYALIRELYINKDAKYELYVNQAFSFYIGVLALSFLLFCPAMLLLRFFVEKNISIILVCLIAFNLVLNFALINFKNIMIAIDQYEYFQRVEFIRRGIIMLSLLSLTLDNSFVLGNIIANVVLIYLIYRVRVDSGFFNSWFNFSEAKQIYLSLFTKAKHFFMFTINETLIYNSGFIMVPLFYNDFSVIQFSLCIAVFNGIAMLSRSILDISIHDMTKNLIKGEKRKSYKNFKYSIIISSFISIMVFFILYFFSDLIFDLWMGIKYAFSEILFVGLFVFLIGNVIQHISGTLLVSVQNNYLTLKKLSFVVMLIIVIVQVFIGYLSIGMDYLFLSTSLIYFLSSLFYLFKCIKLFRK